MAHFQQFCLFSFAFYNVWFDEQILGFLVWIWVWDLEPRLTLYILKHSSNLLAKLHMFEGIRRAHSDYWICVIGATQNAKINKLPLGQFKAL